MSSTNRPFRSLSPLRTFRKLKETARESAHLVEIAALQRSVALLRAERDDARQDERAATRRVTELEREVAALRRSGRAAADVACERRARRRAAPAA